MVTADVRLELFSMCLLSVASTFWGYCLQSYLRHGIGKIIYSFFSRKLCGLFYAFLYLWVAYFSGDSLSALVCKVLWSPTCTNIASLIPTGTYLTIPPFFTNFISLSDVFWKFPTEKVALAHDP
jgi:hypothetical protein